jgi:PAS domain S-box-containing protein
MHQLYDADPKPGDHILGFMSPQTQAFWHPYYEKAFAGQAALTIVEREIQGSLKFYEVTFHPIMRDDRTTDGATIFIKDITDRKMVEDTIRETQKMLVSINRNIKEGIYRSTPKEGLVYVNKAFLDMFGYESKEEMYKLGSDALYVDPDRRKELMQSITQNREFTNEEVLYVRKDGSHFYGMTSSLIWEDEEGNMYYDGAIRDMTDIIEAEHQLREQNEELRKVNTELDRFVYSTSHDLRAPLMSISGLISISKMEDDREKQMYYYGLMEQSITKLDNFIKDIINFSRNARTEVDIQEIDIKDLIQQCKEELQFGEKYDQITFQIETDGIERIFTDEKRLAVILKNLLANAARYHDFKKESPFILVNAKAKGENIQITVQDNGQGIPEKMFDKIFDMFYRGSNQSKGTGLGLYIAKEAVEKLQGKIWVESTLGEGSTFFIEIPRRTEATKLDL